MSDGKFGGPPTGRSADDASYGFFAGKGGGTAGQSSFGGPTSFGITQPAQFAGPAAPAPAPAFGSPSYGPPPAPGAGNPFGSPGSVPYTGAPAPAAKPKRGPLILVLVLVVVLGGGFYGFRLYQHHRAITIPTTLGGLSQSSDPRVTAVLDSTRKSVQAANQDFNLDAGIYGTGKDIAVLLIGRGDVNVANELAAFQGATQQVGSNTCLVQADKTAVGCLRTGGQLTVIVFTTNVQGDLTRASSMVDEAWRQQ